MSAIVAVGELQWIKADWEPGVDMCYDQPFKALNDDGCQNQWAVVIKDITLLMSLG